MQLEMPDVNRVIMAGTVVDTPSLRWTKKGTPVTNFRIAYSSQSGGHPEEENNGEAVDSECVVGVVVWAKLAERCCLYLRSGSPVMIIGELQSRGVSTEDQGYQNKVEIVAKWIRFLREERFREEGQRVQT